MINKIKPKVLIIGLGKIGMGFDFNEKNNEIALTHAQSFNNNNNYNLVGGVDLDIKKRDSFSSKFKCPSFENIKNAMIALQPDIIVISTSTNMHLSNLNEVFLYGNPEIIICEKPIAYEYSDSFRFNNLCKQKGSSLFINYFRRVEPGFLKILSMLKSGEIKPPFNGLCIYSKGLYNSASHFINLFEYFFGEVKNIQIIRKNDYKFDPEPDFELIFEEGNIIFLNNKNDSVFLNNIELIMKNGKITFENGGLETFWKPFIDDPRYDNYKILKSSTKKIKNDFNKLQHYFVEQISLYLNNQPINLCTGDQALMTQKVLEQIKTQL